MKKIFLGLIAIATAFTLHALNEPVNANFSDPDTGDAADELVWYRVNNSNVIPDASAIMFSGEKKTKAYAQAHSPCDIGSTSDCLRGFTAPIPSTSFPNNGAGNDQVKKP